MADVAVKRPVGSRLGQNFIAGLLVGFMCGISFAFLANNSSAIDLSIDRLWKLGLLSSGTESPDHIADKLEERLMTDLYNPHLDDGLPVLPTQQFKLSPNALKDVRVLCWVMTGPQNHKTKAAHVKATWGKRMDKLIFMSSKKDDALGTVVLDVEEGRSWLYEKTRQAFKHVWNEYKDEYDWFMKADDDTFVIPDNLKLMLKDYDPAKPIYFGYKFNMTSHVKKGYFSGGSGYVLSKEALRRFVEIGLNNSTCKERHGDEDVQMGVCMEKLGVVAGDSRDRRQQERFMALAPYSYLFPDNLLPDWYHERMYYPQQKGKDCCSEYPISFHYVTGSDMYVFDYFLYHARVFGN